MKGDLIYQFLTDDDMLRISRRIEKAELNTSGEIRVSVKERTPLLDRKKPVSERARKEFFRLGMDKTRDKTGILIFIALREHEFYILADSGINERVEQRVWDGIRDRMQEMFRTGRFSEGIIHGVENVGAVLSTHFPRKEDDKNELSNKIEF